MSKDLKDKVIVITGASSGIGRATALQCADAGMNVVAMARRLDRLETLAGEIEKRGRQAEIVVGDVADPETSARLLEAAANRFGRFDAVFSNAGYGMEKSVVDLTMPDLRQMFEVNFFASVDLVREAARRLIDEGRPGHLLMCSSCLAKFTLPGYSAYSATKAAQNHVSRAMGIELRPHRIDVSSVHPITTVTEFFEVAQTLSGQTAESDKPGHAARGFVQTTDRVAKAVVRCLRRPRPEVWTSFIVRSTAAMMTFSPRLMDVVMKKAAANDGA